MKKRRSRRKQYPALPCKPLSKKPLIDRLYGYAKNRVYVLADSFIKMGESTSVLGMAGMLLNVNSYSEKVFALGVLLLSCGIILKKSKENKDD